MSAQKKRGQRRPAQPWRTHGRLVVSRDGHSFEHEDGTPFFWLGDTAWGLHQNLSRRDVRLYLDDARQSRFNVIQLMASNPWGLNKQKNCFGDRPYIAGNATRLNPRYWEHLAWVVDEAAARGLFVLLVYGCPGRIDERLPFVETAQQAYAYGHGVGRHLAGRPNMIWSNGIDVNPDDTRRVSKMGMAGWHAMAEGVADGVNGKRTRDGKPDYSTLLMTYHPRGWANSAQWFHDADWLHFNGIQVGMRHEKLLCRTIRADYRLRPAKPVVNLEPWYERVAWKKDGTPVNAWDVRVQAYQGVFAGAAGHAYGHHDIWPMDAPRAKRKGKWKRALGAPGRRQMPYLRRLMDTMPQCRQRPAAPLLTGAPNKHHKSMALCVRIGATAAADRCSALVYTPQGEPFEIDMGRLNGKRVRARWFSPRSGAWRPVGVLACKDTRGFAPPGKPGQGNDWVLALDACNQG